MKNMQMIKNRKIYFALLAISVLSFSSCLKDTGPVQDFGKSAALVGFQYTGNSAVLMTASVPPGTDDSVGLEVTLSVVSITLKSDVTVTVALDQASLDAYNTANGTTYTMLDPSLYTMPAGGKLVIKAGQQIVPFVLHINANGIDFSTDPALAFKITNAQGATIASNLNVIIVPVKLRNQFEANYTVTGYFVHPSSPRPLNATKALTTISAIRSEGQVGDLGGWLFDFDVDGSNNLKNFAPMGSTSASANFVNGVDNASGDATYPGPPFVYTTYNNTYDPSTQTFWMHYGYSGSNPVYSREIYEKWVRQ